MHVHYWPFVRGITWPFVRRIYQSALWGQNHQSLAGSPWPHKGPVMWSFDIYFVVSPNKLLIKQLICRWFEMPWRSCGVSVMLMASLGSVWLIGCYCFQERLGLQTVGESIPMCAKCGKCFTRMWSLQQHDREVHQKTKTHVCPYCFRAFARNTNLTQHINRHRRKSLIATGAALARQFLKGPSSSVAQQPPPPPPQELVQRDSWPKSPDYMPFKEMVRSGPYVVEDLSMGQASKENKPVDGWGWWGHVYDVIWVVVVRMTSCDGCGERDPNSSGRAVELHLRGTSSWI